MISCLACRPRAQLADSPPSIDEHTTILPAFDPAAMSDPAATGLDLDSALAGPPAPPEPPPLPDPEVLDYGPTAEASDYPTVQIRFNRPMVPLGQKTRVSAREAGFEISPAIEGEAYWAEPTRLVFEPKTALARAQTYTVKFRRRLESVDGPALDVALAWSFGTAPPQVSMRAAWDHQMADEQRFDWDTPIHVTASPDIELAQLRRHLELSAHDEHGNHTPVAFVVRKSKRAGDHPGGFEITPKTRWPADAEIVARVDGQLRGSGGPRPLGVDSVYSFDTSAGVRALYRHCNEGEYDDGCEIGPVSVSFSAPIARSQAKYISITPEPKRFGRLPIPSTTGENAHYSVGMWGEFQRGVNYRIEVDPRLKDVHGQPIVGQRSFSVRFVEPPPALSLRQAFGTLISPRGTKVGIEGRHLDGARVRVAVLSEAELEALYHDALNSWPADIDATHEHTIKLDHRGQWGWSSHELDITDYTGAPTGAALVEVSAASLLPRARGRTLPKSELGLVQLSDLGVYAVGSLPGGVVRVAHVSSGAPVAGATVELVDGTTGAHTRLAQVSDADGLVELPAGDRLPDDLLLRVRTAGGRETVLIDVHELDFGGQLEGPLRRGEDVRTSLTSERPLYRPGERVRAMGWAAIASPYQLSSLRRLPAKTKVTLELRDFRDELVARRTVQAKDHGKFWATLELPETAALGYYTLTAELLGRSARTSIRVEDFPTPEFEVTATASRTDVHAGEDASVAVDASYYFGGRVPITAASTTNHCSEVEFRPPGLAPAWTVAPQLDRYLLYGSYGHAPTELALGPTAERGHLEYPVSLGPKRVDQPLHCTHSVAVGDASGRFIGAESTIWVHPEFYLAARGPHSLDAGEDARFEIATIDFDGTPVRVADVAVTLERRWSEARHDAKGRFAGWRSRKKTLSPCKTKSDGRASCSFAKLEHGSYTVAIRAKHGRYAPELDSWLWVRQPSGHLGPQPPVRELEVRIETPPTPPTSPTSPTSTTQQDAGAALSVGDRARAVVQAPWASGVGLVMLDKGGLHGLRPFELVDGRAVVEFEVDDAWIPGLSVTAVAIDPRTIPVVESARTRVVVDDSPRVLEVEVAVPAEAQTGATLPIEIGVRDVHGDPAPGHVSVWAVDEAVLSLAPLSLPDFVERFELDSWPALRLASGYDELTLPYTSRDDPYSPRPFDPNWTDDGLGLVGLVGSGRGGGGTGAGTIGLGNTGLIGKGFGSSPRANFSTVPIFIGDAEVDADGIARVSGQLPDNLTTFRVYAVASAPLAASKGKGKSKAVEARFGVGDGRVRVTRPLVVRAALPRVLRPGDQAEVGVLVDNLRGGAGTVEIAVALHDAEGVLELLSPATTTAPIEAGGQLRVPMTIRAHSSGSPRFEVHATLKPAQGSALRDALRLPLPVEAERTQTERVAVYGDLADDGAALLPFALPDDADPRHGGLSVSVGATLLGGLQDAVAYLVDYPHGCVEQTSSRLLPLIPLARMQDQGYPLGIADVDGFVEHGVARLRSMQLESGGFSYWPGSREPAPYASAYATWVLGRAEAAGFHVPPAMLADADAYLLTLVEAWSARTGPPPSEDIETALMLWTLAEHGLAPAAAVDQLYARRTRLPVFAQAMLLLALDAQPGTNDDPRIQTLMGELRSVIDEREAVAKVETSGSRWTWYWDSDTRSSALALMAMLRVDPQHPLVPKLTRGLLEVRRGGRWSNTQENAYALMALADYAAVYEAEAPAFDGRVWLDDELLASVHVEGRAGTFEDGFTPMERLLEAKAGSAQQSDRLILERAGQGRMYYRVGLEWASTATDKPARAEGIRIARTLRSAAGTIGSDVAVTAGELLAIDVEIEIPAALDHVAIEVPIPAGIETVNLELGKGGAAMKLAGSRGSWVSHQELRRDRAVLFADHLEPGRHVSTVFLRATTPGDYVMPASSAEMMYYPEVYGRTTARRLLVR